GAWGAHATSSISAMPYKQTARVQ
ncbi:MAG: hypothetical protein QOH37_3479, partial [Nocardioidaceae bacterium]|nr:hypothetical protein [Nocardioidaceae bacterium]